MKRIDEIFDFNSKKKKCCFCFCVALILGILGWAFSFFNPSVKLDAVSFNFEWRAAHLYGIGRFTQRIYEWLTSMVRIDFFDGLCWLCFVALIVYYTDSLFDFNDKFFIFIFSSVFIFSGISVRCQTFFPFASPLFALTVLLGVLAVYLLKKYKFGWIYFILLNVMATGTYQNGICVSMGLIAILTVCDLLKGESVSKTVIETLKGVLYVVLSLILYFIVYKATLKIFKVNADSAYNSSERIAFFGVKRSIVLCVKTYVLFFRNLVVCDDYGLVGLFNGFSSVYEIYLLILWVIAIYVTFVFLERSFSLEKTSVIKRIAVICIVCLVPFCFACICVVSNGLWLHNLYVQDYLILALPFIIVKNYKQKALNENLDEQREKRYEIADKICFIAITVAVSLVAIALSVIFKTKSVAITFCCQLPLVVLAVIIYARKTKLNVWNNIKRVLIGVLSSLFVFNGIIYANAISTENYLYSQRVLVQSAILCEIIENAEDENGEKVYKEGMSLYFIDDELDVLPYERAFMVDYINNTLKTEYIYLWSTAEDMEKLAEEAKELKSFPDKDCLKKSEAVENVLIIRLS